MTRRLSRLAKHVRRQRLVLETLERRDVPSFLGASSQSVGASLTDITSADFNGDGADDVAISSLTATGLVSVLLSDGNGAFQPPTAYSTGNHTRAVAAADLNGDGFADLAAANLGPYPQHMGTLGILLGNGDGTFLPEISYAVGAEKPTAVTIGDFNGDFKPDIATGTDSSFATVNIFIGNGNGTFQPPASLPNGKHMRLKQPNGVPNAEARRPAFSRMSHSGIKTSFFRFAVTTRVPDYAQFRPSVGVLV